MFGFLVFAAPGWYLTDSGSFGFPAIWWLDTEAQSDSRLLLPGQTTLWAELCSAGARDTWFCL